VAADDKPCVAYITIYGFNPVALRPLRLEE
jgi:hypothetical protein